MKYMTDANIAHVAPKLRAKGIDCQTVHMVMRGHEKSQESISDGEMRAFLREHKEPITVIVSNLKLADDLRWDKIPHITIWDAVGEHILNSK